MEHLGARRMMDACFVHRMYWNEEKIEKPMVEGSYAPNKGERAANAAQRQQENERRHIRARRIEGDASEFH